jgi:Na+-translocating ferredoxin:NAD+ oxidoreductase subunit E
VSDRDSSDAVLQGAHCGPVGLAPARPGRTTATQDLLRGIWQENPVFRQLLGLCPALAVTNTVANSLAMGIATFGVLLGSSLLVSACKRAIPEAVRLSTYILIIATWVTIADMLMEAIVPDIQKALGAFVYLIVVNCLILSRQEAFASRQPVGRAFLDAVGTGSGNVLALLAMGTLREVVGSGRFLGIELFGPAYEPWIVMVLPPGGFFAIGFILLAVGWHRARQDARRAHRVRASRVAVEEAA